MKKYQGTKTIQAEPMDEFEAIKRGFVRENDGKHDMRQGYHVVYPDGYNSWSPKNVFDKAYKPADDFLDRLMIEASDLDKKFEKAVEFVHTDRFYNLSSLHRSLLRAQIASMKAYSEILHIRIERIIDERNNAPMGCDCRRPECPGCPEDDDPGCPEIGVFNPNNPVCQRSTHENGPTRLY